MNETQPHSRTSVIMWRRPDNVPLRVLPEELLECVIRPQMFVVLHHITCASGVTFGLTLVSLRIGTVERVPFELESNDAAREILRQRHGIPFAHSYRLAGLEDPALQKKLAQSGFPVATLAPIPSIALVPGCDVVLVLRNDTRKPVQAHVALVVQEELS